MKFIQTNPDDLSTYNFFTITQLVLLFLFAYFFSCKAFIFEIILSSLLIYMFRIYGSAIGHSFANAPPKSDFFDKDAIKTTFLFALYSLYLSFGISCFINFFKYKQDMNIFFYPWLLSIFTTFILIHFFQKNNSHRKF